MVAGGMRSLPAIREGTNAVNHPTRRALTLKQARSPRLAGRGDWLNMAARRRELGLARALATTEKSLASAPAPTNDDQPPPLLSSPERFINRELSWLEFNRRVLEEADNPTIRCSSGCGSCRSRPTISTSSSWSASPACVGQVLRRRDASSPTTASRPAEQLDRDQRARRRADRRAAGALARRCGPSSREGASCIVDVADAHQARDATGCEDYFLSTSFPVLTPLAIDPAHPFPFIPNLGFTLALELTHPRDGTTMNALVPLPAQVDRFVRLPDAPARRRARFVMLEQADRRVHRPAVSRLRGHGRRALPRHPRQRHRNRGRGRGSGAPVRDRAEAAPARLGHPARDRRQHAGRLRAFVAGDARRRRRGDRADRRHAGARRADADHRRRPART